MTLQNHQIRNMKTNDGINKSIMSKDRHLQIDNLYHF